MSSGNYHAALNDIESAMTSLDPSLSGSGLPNCMLLFTIHVIDISLSISLYSNL